MALRVTEFTADLSPAVMAFNDRLSASPQGMRFSEQPSSHRARQIRPRTDYLLCDDERQVRGAYGVRLDRFWLRDREEVLDYYAAPVAEGIVDRRFALAGLQILIDAEKRCQKLYGLGGGSLDQASPKLLLKKGWSSHEVPMLFRIDRPAAVLRALPRIQANGTMRIAASLLAASGIPSAVNAVLQAAPAWRAGRALHGLEWESVSSLGAVADEVWSAARSALVMAGLRDRAHTDILFPSSEPRLEKIIVRAQGRAVGWAVLLRRCAVWQRHFGALDVALVVDALAVPGYEMAVASGATRALGHGRPDIQLTFQNHPIWKQAFHRLGFRTGPAVFHFLASPSLVERLSPFSDTLEQAHLTRADGDGALSLV